MGKEIKWPRLTTFQMGQERVILLQEGAEVVCPATLGPACITLSQGGVGNTLDNDVICQSEHPYVGERTVKSQWLDTF